MGATAWRYAPLLLVVAAWEAAPRIGFINPAALPPFSVVVHAWWYKLFLPGDLVVHGASSLADLAAGLALSILVGISLGLVMAWYRPIDLAVSPLIGALYPLPRSALIPVMILWFGLGSGSKIASVFLGCLLPVVLSTYNGARGVDRALVWSALAAGARRRAVLWEVVLPAAMPEILAGVRNALALSFILLVAAEFLVGRRGLGYLISFLGEGGVYDAMFAGVLTVAAVGFLADRLYLLFMTWMLRWRE
jgi:NitT/TauT family transport system permease protein